LLCKTSNAASDHRDELALSISIAVNVPLCRLDRPMTRQQLHVAQRPTCVVGEARSTGNECSPPRVGRTAVETNEPTGVGKPDYDTQRRHQAAEETCTVLFALNRGTSTISYSSLNSLRVIDRSREINKAAQVMRLKIPWRGNNTSRSC
jgi:hypothetical protein